MKMMKKKNEEIKIKFLLAHISGLAGSIFRILPWVNVCSKFGLNRIRDLGAIYVGVKITFLVDLFTVWFSSFLCHMTHYHVS